MKQISNNGAELVTVTVKCKRCLQTFNQELPKSFVDICYEIDADEFVGTCPICAAEDPIFKALHPGRAGRGRVLDGSTANGVAAGTSSDDYKPEQRREGCDDRH
jgi:hypothetical protein